MFFGLGSLCKAIVSRVGAGLSWNERFRTCGAVVAMPLERRSLRQGKHAARPYRLADFAVVKTLTSKRGMWEVKKNREKKPSKMSAAGTAVSEAGNGGINLRGKGRLAWGEGQKGPVGEERRQRQSPKKRTIFLYIRASSVGADYRRSEVLTGGK